MTTDFTKTLRKEERAYENGTDRPLGSYLRVLTVYGGAVAGLVALGKLTGARPPRRIAVLDLLLMGVSTHRLSRTITKDPVTSPLRAPFTRYAGVSGPAELREEVRGHGLRHAVGELVTCPFCIAQWVATAYAAGMVWAPGLTRLAGATMSAVAISDWLQLGYATLMQAAEGPPQGDQGDRRDGSGDGERKEER
ncbi:hypothetical protein Sme01_68790 [Sphaerisporangium melleum]|uniref:DUF1360 domain-containing protein n=1 Tax=Sphaerisporangium melleum TaxID=321316 RepID=A0A917RL77_9ACTN|nr:DUF1360 domain-containing protein [Sphaerisporangium melleum]GGL12208.1 hypothetical protein GCM10007964_62820 [Sphaerisporangium melleum]GII74403.1 hypothetical protein Sme01_68790 [Sphaerisporangium melleum]